MTTLLFCTLAALLAPTVNGSDLARGMYKKMSSDARQRSASVAAALSSFTSTDSKLGPDFKKFCPETSALVASSKGQAVNPTKFFQVVQEDGADCIKYMCSVPDFFNPSPATPQCTKACFAVISADSLCASENTEFFNDMITKQASGKNPETCEDPVEHDQESYKMVCPILKTKCIAGLLRTSQYTSGDNSTCVIGKSGCNADTDCQLDEVCSKAGQCETRCRTNFNGPASTGVWCDQCDDACTDGYCQDADGSVDVISRAIQDGYKYTFNILYASCMPDPAKKGAYCHDALRYTNASCDEIKKAGILDSTACCAKSISDIETVVAGCIGGASETDDFAYEDMVKRCGFDGNKAICPGVKVPPDCSTPSCDAIGDHSDEVTDEKSCFNWNLCLNRRGQAFINQVAGGEQCCCDLDTPGSADSYCCAIPKGKPNTKQCSPDVMDKCTEPFFDAMSCVKKQKLDPSDCDISADHDSEAYQACIVSEKCLSKSYGQNLDTCCACITLLSTQFDINLEVHCTIPK
jgi:hypothetical protein